MFLLDRYNIMKKVTIFLWIILYTCFLVSKLRLHPTRFDVTFDDTLCDSSSFGKACTSLIVNSTFAFKIHAIKS